MLGAGIGAIFAVVAVVLFQILPGPRTRTDYLVVGTLGTFAALAVLFAVLTASGGGRQELFFRRKKR
jgi:hypothetical protein